MHPAWAEQPDYPGGTATYRSWIAAELPGSPEGLTRDGDGTLYASLFRHGKIARLDEKGGYEIVATLPDKDLGPQGVTIGIEFDDAGFLYAAFLWNYNDTDLFDPLHLACRDARDQHTGIYRVNVTTGEVDPFVTRADGWPGCLPDDIAIDKSGNLYVTDLTLGALWKISPGGAFELWSTDPLIAVPEMPASALPLGPNALVLNDAENALYVGTTGNPMVVRIPINPDGSAGPGVAIARYIGANDGIDLDENGNIFIAEPQFDAITVLSPDGQRRLQIANRELAPLVGPTSLVAYKGTVCTANVNFAASLEEQSTHGTVTCVSGYRVP